MNEQQRASALHIASIMADAAVLEAQRDLRQPLVLCVGVRPDGAPCNQPIPLRSGPVLCESCKAQQ